MNDAINPTHYQSGKAQLIDLIEDLPGNRFNAAKYVVRAGKKNPDTLIEDLRKAAWYIDRELYRLGASEYNPADADTAYKPSAAGCATAKELLARYQADGTFVEPIPEPRDFYPRGY